MRSPRSSARLSRTNRLTPQLAAEIASASDENFRQRTVTVLEGDKGYRDSARAAGSRRRQLKLPDAIKGDFSSFTMDGGHLNLRAVKHADAGGKHLVVISNVPVNSGLLQRTAAMVGAIYLYPPKPEIKQKTKAPASPSLKREKRSRRTASPSTSAAHVDSDVSPGRTRWRFSQHVDVGKVPPPANSFDREFNFWTLFNATDWQTGYAGNRRDHGQHPAIASLQRALRQAGREGRHLHSGARRHRHLLRRYRADRADSSAYASRAA